MSIKGSARRRTSRQGLMWSVESMKRPEITRHVAQCLPIACESCPWLPYNRVVGKVAWHSKSVGVQVSEFPLITK